MIAKRADAPYTSGRARDWLKFKCENNQEFVIGGFTDPQGSRTGLGALLLGYYDGSGKLTYAGKVGTGFDTRMLHRLHEELAPLERDRPAFEAGSCRRAAGCTGPSRGWSRRSGSASGPPPGSCATRDSPDCAGTRARPR